MIEQEYKPIPIHISDITKKGFNLHIHGIILYIAREVYPWFLGASDSEIFDVTAFPGDPEDHGDWLRWKSLDVELGLNDIERLKYFPERMLTKEQWERVERHKGITIPRPYTVNKKHFQKFYQIILDEKEQATS